MDREVGALPYRIRKEKVEVVLVTTRNGKQWIFPKGQLEKQLSNAEVAELEAFEEAGIRGKIDKDLARVFTVRRGNRRVKLKVYPLKFDSILSKWPESDERERRVFPIDDALKKIKCKSLRKFVKRMLRDVA